MPNKWVEHVKAYASANGLSYACAMTNADCKASYKKYDPSKTKVMTREKRAEVNKKAREITKALKKKSATDAPTNPLGINMKAIAKADESKNRFLKVYDKDVKMMLPARVRPYYDKYLKLKNDPLTTGKLLDGLMREKILKTKEQVIYFLNEQE